MSFPGNMEGYCQAERHSNGAPKALCLCSAKVIYFFAVLLAFALGLIVAALNSAVILASLAAVVTFAVVMFVLIVALLIYRYCACCPRTRKCE